MREELSLSELALKLLDALKETPGELTGRNDLAKRIGKNKLNAREVAALDLLVETGRAERVRVEDPRPVGYRFEYRSIEGK